MPGVFPQLSTKRVLTAEFVNGKPVDLCVDEPKEVSIENMRKNRLFKQVRDWIATKYVELCLREVFHWRFMQVFPFFHL